MKLKVEACGCVSQRKIILKYCERHAGEELEKMRRNKGVIYNR